MKWVMTQFEKRKQVIYILAPLFLTIACLVLINITPRWLAAETPTSAAITSPPQSTAAAVEPAEMAASSTPASAPIMTPAPPPLPALPPGAVIELLGPPPGSSFRLAGTISFYWRWPAPLSEGQSLGIYVRLNGQELLLGQLDEPNVGQDYRWQVDVGTLTETAVSGQWFVRLQSPNEANNLLESEPRTFNILP